MRRPDVWISFFEDLANPLSRDTECSSNLHERHGLSELNYALIPLASGDCMQAHIDKARTIHALLAVLSGFCHPSNSC